MDGLRRALALLGAFVTAVAQPDDAEAIVYRPNRNPPHDYQIEMALRRPERHLVFAAGRGSGKSETGEYWVANGLTRKFDAQYIVVAPTYSSAKRRYWKPLQTLLGPAIRDISKSDLRLELWNGSWVQLFGANNPDSLRNLHVDGALIDEEDEQYDALFPEVIGPMLIAKRGGSMHLGTPKGRRALYRHFKFGQPGPEKQPGWYSYTMKSIDAPHLDSSLVLAAKASMDEFLFRQEYEASFDLRTGAVFADYDESEHVDEVLGEYDQYLPVYGCEDFNIGFQFSAFFQEHYVPGRKRPRIVFFAEVVSRDIPTEQHVARMADYLDREFKVRPAEVTMHTDATGAARQRAGESDVHAIQAAGFQVRNPKSNPNPEDRNNAVRAFIRDANGTSSLKIHPRCKALRSSLENWRYVDGSNPPQADKTEGHDHACEAIGYGIHFRHPLEPFGRALRARRS